MLDAQITWEMSVKKPRPERGIAFEPTTVQIDSSAAKALALNKQVSDRNNHIDLKYHFVKAAIASRIIHLIDVNSENNPADLLTKIIEIPTLLHLCQITRLI